MLLVGAGSGYLAAVLGHLAREVVALERQQAVAAIAEANLKRAGLDNVDVVAGRGEDVDAERAPFDLVLSSCFLARTDTLLSQLAEGGSLVTLEGTDPLAPELVRYVRRRDASLRRGLGPIRVDDQRLIVATDNPESQTDDIRNMRSYSAVERVLVTPTDFRRLWSNIDITTRGGDVDGRGRQRRARDERARLLLRPGPSAT